MTSKHIFVPALAAMLALSACAQGPYATQSQKETAGALVGAAAGGLLGGQLGEGSGKTVSAVAGALLGAWAGSQVVRGMSQQDYSYYQDASTRASTAPVGQTINWYNPQSGNYGTVTPVREGRSSTGGYCREFSQTIVVDGRSERAYGTACQNPDGTWRIVN